MNRNTFVATTKKMAQTTTDWVKTLGTLASFASVDKPMVQYGETFLAHEVPLSGATMSALEKVYGIVKVVDTQEVWVKIDDETMKKKEINVYALNVSVDEIVAIMVQIPREKKAIIERKIASHIEAIKQYQLELAELGI